MPFKFEKLEAWQKAIDFCDKVLAYAEKLPQPFPFRPILRKAVGVIIPKRAATFMAFPRAQPMKWSICWSSAASAVF